LFANARFPLGTRKDEGSMLIHSLSLPRRQFVYSPHSTQTLVDTAEQAGQTNSPAPPVVP